MKILSLTNAFAVLLMLSACGAPEEERDSSSAGRTLGASTAPDTVPSPVRKGSLFGDSLNRVLFWADESRITHRSDTLRIDGEPLVYIANAELPLRIATSLIHMEVLELPLLMKVDAFDKHAGQSLEVFEGTVVVRKSYNSPFPEVDTLQAGNLYMINKNIDLSEVEELDDYRLYKWWKANYIIFTNSSHSSSRVPVWRVRLARRYQ